MDCNQAEATAGESAVAGQGKDIPLGHTVRASKDELLGGGASEIVEQLSTGDIVKSPWPGPRAETCRRDIMTESQIYARLGAHPRLVKIIDWDPKECILTMEYMSNGNLKDFILAKNDSISLPQRFQWAQEAAEGIKLLHAADLIHCDIGPRNFFLDTYLNLKIADFGGFSLNGSRASACAKERFSPPDFDWRRQLVVQDDLFGLGSFIYFIMAGQYPFPELASEEVEAKYKAHEFPDVENIECRDMIKRCWNLEAGSAKEMLQSLKDKV